MSNLGVNANMVEKPQRDWHGDLGEQFNRALEDAEHEMNCEKMSEALRQGAILVAGKQAFAHLKSICETYGVEIRLCPFLKDDMVYVVSKKFFEFFLAR